MWDWTKISNKTTKNSSFLVKKNGKNDSNHDWNTVDEEDTSQASDTLWKEEICLDILQYTALYAWYITVLIKDVMGRDVSCYTDLVIVHDADLTQSIYTSEVHLYYNIVPVRFL